MENYTQDDTQANVLIPMSPSQANELMDFIRYTVSGQTEKLTHLSEKIRQLLNQALHDIEEDSDPEEFYSLEDLQFGRPTFELIDLTLTSTPEGLALFGSEGAADLVKITAIIQAALQLYDLPPVGFEYSRPGGFQRPQTEQYGGGAIVVTKTSIQHTDTSELLDQMLKRNAFIET